MGLREKVTVSSIHPSKVLPLWSLWSLWFKTLTGRAASRLTPKINLDHARIVLHGVQRTLGQHAAFMQHRHLARDARDEGHVVLDHDQRMGSREGQEKLRGALRLVVAHARDRLVEQEKLRF